MKFKHIFKQEMDGHYHTKTLIQEQSAFYFKEVMKGIFIVEKDRFDDFDDDFVKTKAVFEKLNESTSVAVERLDGDIIINRHLSTKIALQAQ